MKDDMIFIVFKHVSSNGSLLKTHLRLITRTSLFRAYSPPHSHWQNYFPVISLELEAPLGHTYLGEFSIDHPSKPSPKSNMIDVAFNYNQQLENIFTKLIKTTKFLTIAKPQLWHQNPKI